jgi:hypothetical protein
VLVVLVSERYRAYADDCLKAADAASDAYYRRLHLNLAASWLKLANQDDAVSTLLSSWGVTSITEATLVSD